LSVVGAVVGEPVVRLRAGPEDALVGDVPGHRRRAAGHKRQRHLIDGMPCVYVWFCRFRHLLLLSAVVPGPRRRPTAGAAAPGRGASRASPSGGIRRRACMRRSGPSSARPRFPLACNRPIVAPFCLPSPASSFSTPIVIGLNPPNLLVWLIPPHSRECFGAGR